MKRKRSDWLHHPDLYVLDRPIVARRPVLPLVKPVVFRIHAPKANDVRLVGKFASDGFSQHEMKKLVDGYWECTIELPRGHYEYHFLVDGAPATDPRAVARVKDDQGQLHSVVEVG